MRRSTSKLVETILSMIYRAQPSLRTQCSGSAANRRSSHACVAGRPPPPSFDPDRDSTHDHFIQLAALQLIERRRISPEDPVVDYLPQMANPVIIEDEMAGINQRRMSFALSTCWISRMGCFTRPRVWRWMTSSRRMLRYIRRMIILWGFSMLLWFVKVLLKCALRFHDCLIRVQRTLPGYLSNLNPERIVRHSWFWYLGGTNCFGY